MLYVANCFLYENKSSVKSLILDKDKIIYYNDDIILLKNKIDISFISKFNLFCKINNLIYLYNEMENSFKIYFPFKIVKKESIFINKFLTDVVKSYKIKKLYDLVNFLKIKRKEYLNLELDVENYRQINKDFLFKLNLSNSVYINYTLDKNLLDINYNFYYLNSLITILIGGKLEF